MADGMQKVIGTHSGKFHADEVLGCVLLKQLPEYKSAVIKRSRDPEVLDKCDIVIDVGGVYNHNERRYDHHQKSFCETFQTVTGEEGDIKLSSAGLVWAHYGKDVIKAFTGNKFSEKDMKVVYCRMYDCLIKEIDAKDNGIEASTPPIRYRTFTDLPSRISRLNHRVCNTPDEEDELFMKAFELAKTDFFDILENMVNFWMPSRTSVYEALEKRFSVDPTGRIICLEKGVSWPSHLIKLEPEFDAAGDILYVLFPAANEGWRVQAVPKDSGFDVRQQVLPSCLGLRDKEIAAKCGVEDAVFVHMNGFIGGARSYKGALRMAQLSLDDLYNL